MKAEKEPGCGPPNHSKVLGAEYSGKAGLASTDLTQTVHDHLTREPAPPRRKRAQTLPGVIPQLLTPKLFQLHLRD
jgi:hypothetical protein